MKQFIQGVLLGGLLCAALMAIPNEINFQSRLTSNGLPVTGTQNIIFSLVSGSTTVVWTTNQAVYVNQGFYNALLTIPLNVWDVSANYALRVNVNGQTLTPDVTISAVPYAQLATLASAITANTFAGNSVVAALNQSSDYLGLGVTNPIQRLVVSGSIMVTGNGAMFIGDGSGLTNIPAGAFAVTVGNISGVMPVSKGGTGSAGPAQARVNLGLGDMSVQISSSVNISGGLISTNITINATAASANFAYLSATANYATTANFAITANYALLVSTNYVTANYFTAVTINNNLVVASGKYMGNGSSLTKAVSVIAANTLLDDTYSVVLVDTTAGFVTVTLPAAASFPGREYIIKKTDASANTVVIAAGGADSIDLVPTYTLTASGQSLIVISDGVSAWQIVGKY